MKQEMNRNMLNTRICTIPKPIEIQKPLNPTDTASKPKQATSDTTVSALFTARYTSAKEIKRNAKMQDKMQKKLS
jgi:hypothetical protein